MRIITFLILLLIILLGISFASLNAAPVVVNYYLGSCTLPLSLLVVLVLACGAILGILVNFPIMIRLKRKNMQYAHRIKLIEKELDNLRTSPLKETH